MPGWKARRWAGRVSPCAVRFDEGLKKRLECSSRSPGGDSGADASGLWRCLLALWQSQGGRHSPSEGADKRCPGRSQEGAWREVPGWSAELGRVGVAGGGPPLVA